ncbi:MAG: 50S ribosomal protein L25/general stress protein Ctc [Bacteroidetes bacterium]|nr:50S ribosomal protein L25/general stress protein Ctc [Bacteroidota bacterium]
MKTVSMSGSLRENVGKKDAKMNRRNGKVPCVLYGGKDQIHFIANEKDFKDIIFTPEVCFIDLDINGKQYKATLQDVQYHPVSDNILHVDFLQITDDKPIIMSIPIKVVGTSPGVLRGGKLVVKMRKLKVKALPVALPDTIKVDISTLDIADFVKVNTLTVEGVEFLNVPTSVVVMIKATRGVEDPTATEEAAKK